MSRAYMRISHETHSGTSTSADPIPLTDNGPPQDNIELPLPLVSAKFGWLSSYAANPTPIAASAR
jgi:hypothetical protein